MTPKFNGITMAIFFISFYVYDVLKNIHLMYLSKSYKKLLFRSPNVIKKLDKNVYKNAFITLFINAIPCVNQFTVTLNPFQKNIKRFHYFVYWRFSLGYQFIVTPNPFQKKENVFINLFTYTFVCVNQFAVTSNPFQKKKETLSLFCL